MLNFLATSLIAATALYQPLAPEVAPASGGPWDYSMGYSFTPNRNISVTHVGGLFTGSQVVRIYSGNSVLASAVVSGNGATYAYVPLFRPVTLIAGITYAVSVRLSGTSGGGKYYNIPNQNLLPFANNDVRINYSCWVYGATANPCNYNATVSYVYGVPDFLYNGGVGRGCGVISTPGRYQLDRDIATDWNACLTVQDLPSVQPTVIDCRDYTIAGGGGHDVGNALVVKNVSNSRGVTVKNCTLNTSANNTYSVVLENASGTTIENSHIGVRQTSGAARITNSSNVTFQGNLVDGGLEFDHTMQARVVNNQLYCSTRAQAGAIGFVDGSYNTAISNSIFGNWDGLDLSVNAPGCDDGVIVTRENNANVASNYITNVWDAGIETFGLIRDSHFDNNVMTRLPLERSAGIGGWYQMSLDGNTFIGNSCDECRRLFNFYISQPYSSSAFYFRNNLFAYNRLTRPIAGGHMYVDKIQGACNADEAGNVPLYQSNNTIVGNDWTPNACAPDLNCSSPLPTSRVVDGGGNICKPGCPGLVTIACH